MRTLYGKVVARTRKTQQRTERLQSDGSLGVRKESPCHTLDSSTVATASCDGTQSTAKDTT